MTTKKNGKASNWKPGQSGNPAGRPKGTGEVAKLREAIKAHVPDIIENLVARALDGDIGAARLLLERTVAPLKAMEPTQALGRCLMAHSRSREGRLSRLWRVVS